MPSSRVQLEIYGRASLVSSIDMGFIHRKCAVWECLRLCRDTRSSVSRYAHPAYHTTDSSVCLIKQLVRRTVQSPARFFSEPCDAVLVAWQHSLWYVWIFWIFWRCDVTNAYNSTLLVIQCSIGTHILDQIEYLVFTGLSLVFFCCTPAEFHRCWSVTIRFSTFHNCKLTRVYIQVCTYFLIQ